MKDEFSLLQEDIDKALKELKGKKFSLDVDGKPVPIHAVEPDRLPPFAYQIGLNISATHQNIDPASSKPREANAKKKRFKLRVSGSRDVDENFFTASSSLVTSLASTNVIPYPGVSLRTNESVKEGPPPPEDPRRPSRKTFMTKLSNSSSLIRGSATSLSQVGFNNPSTIVSEVQGGGGGGTHKQPPGGRSKSPAASSIQDPPTLESEDNGASSGLSRYTRFAELDPLEGAKPKQKDSPGKPPPKTPDVDESLQSSGGAISSGGRAPPPRLPTKPSLKQGEIVEKVFGGHENPKPRDRDPPRAQVAPTERKKLPPPPVGQVHRPRVVTYGLTSTLGSGASSQADLLGKIRSQSQAAPHQYNSRPGDKEMSDDGSVHSKTAFSATGPGRLQGGKIKTEMSDIYNSLF